MPRDDNFYLLIYLFIYFYYYFFFVYLFFLYIHSCKDSAARIRSKCRCHWRGVSAYLTVTRLRKMCAVAKEFNSWMTNMEDQSELQLRFMIANLQR